MPATGLPPRARAAAAQVARAVEWAEEELEFTDEEIGGAFGGVSTRTVARWRERANQPQPPAVLAAETLLALSHALRVVFRDDRVRMQAWLHEPVAGLGGRTPLRTIVRGKAGEVIALLADLDTGSFA